MKSRIVGAWVALVLAAAAVATAQTYTITAIGVLKGDNESSGFWINNLGEVVGCSDTKTVEGYPCTGLVPGQHAFSWTRSGGMKDLGTLSGATVSAATGLNDSGIVVGYSNVKGQPATNFVAVQWSSTGAITNLGMLPGRFLQRRFRNQFCRRGCGRFVPQQRSGRRHQLEQQENQEPGRSAQGNLYCRTRHQRQRRPSSANPCLVTGLRSPRMVSAGTVPR